MPRAEFHERQYELAANIELIAGRGAFFTPPTTAEKRLGIDCALTPGDPRIWGLLGLPAPRGASIGPSTFPAWPTTFPAGAQPPFLASLFVQYKRPDYLTTRRAKEWRHHGSPYFRMVLTDHQHDLLLRLDQRVGNDGVVFYAAPSYWRYNDIWRNQSLGRIVEDSMLVEAAQIGAGHKAWTWSPGGRGIAHSEPEERELLTIEALRERISEKVRARPRRAPREHLRALATAMLDAQLAEKPRQQWRDEIVDESVWPEAAPPTDETLTELVDAAVVAEGASKAGISWLILALSDKDATD